MHQASIVILNEVKNHYGESVPKGLILHFVQNDKWKWVEVCRAVTVRNASDYTTKSQ